MSILLHDVLNNLKPHLVKTRDLRNVDVWVDRANTLTIVVETKGQASSTTVPTWVEHSILRTLLRAAIGSLYGDSINLTTLEATLKKDPRLLYNEENDEQKEDNLVDRPKQLRQRDELQSFRLVDQMVVEPNASQPGTWRFVEASSPTWRDITRATAPPDTPVPTPRPSSSFWYTSSDVGIDASALSIWHGNARDQLSYDIEQRPSEDEERNDGGQGQSEPSSGG